ncbi:hypothetical protein GP2143_15691 [marine gamma proteobacterium HTCC2143]|uniref:Uncharacterized protein n=1 Tax=marine gamma proteobacterium HTCC2143 TaxID=247633 RepID=A0Y9A8_9GAMM|nr:hypothetical protein GP2143_15691 [marine gamma proteobacterium HTCC2143]
MLVLMKGLEIVFFQLVGLRKVVVRLIEKLSDAKVIAGMARYWWRGQSGEVRLIEMFHRCC